MEIEHRDPAYMAWVRTCRCFVGIDCEGRIHAHHAGERPGMGMKAGDDTCIPLCSKHHAEWHGASGHFREMDKVDRRRWSDTAIQVTQARYVL